MFSNVSWTQYITILLVATIIYYLFIWIVVFKARIPALSRIGALGPSSLHGEDAPDEAMATAQHVIDELRPLFKAGANRNELLFALQQQLSKYNNWDEPGFRDTINQYISRQCGSTCSIRLGDDELRALWK